MRYLLLLISLFALALTSCQKASTTSSAAAPAAKTAATATPAKPDNHAKEDNAPRMTIAEAKAAFDKNEAVFIDSRPEETFKQEHIKGALNISLQDDPSKYDKIPKGKKIIVYCS